jgi:uncharacterized protein YcfL
MKKALFFPLFALLLVGGCVSQGTHDRLKAQNKVMSQEVQTLTSQAESLQMQVSALTSENALLKKDRRSRPGSMICRPGLKRQSNLRKPRRPIRT